MTSIINHSIPQVSVGDLDPFTGLAGSVSIIISVVLMVTGVIFVFFGSRLFKIFLFGFAFLFGAALGYFIIRLVAPNSSVYVALGVCGVLGLILGAMVICLLKAAFFIMGAALGVIIGIVLNALFLTYLIKNQPAINYSIIAVLGIAFGLVGLKFQKVFILIASPFLGSFLIVAGLNNFIFPDTCTASSSNCESFNPLLLATGQFKCNDPTCIGVLAGMIVLGFIGLYVQYNYTSQYADRRREKREIEEAKKWKKEARKSMLKSQKEEAQALRQSQMMDNRRGTRSRSGYYRSSRGSRKNRVPDFLNSRRDYIRNPRRDAEEERLYEERRNFERQQRLSRFNERFGLDRLKTLATLRSLRSLVSRRDRRRGPDGKPIENQDCLDECFGGCCKGNAERRRREQERREEMERVKRMQENIAQKEKILQAEEDALKKQEELKRKEQMIENRRSKLYAPQEQAPAVEEKPREKTRDIENAASDDEDEADRPASDGEVDGRERKKKRKTGGSQARNTTTGAKEKRKTGTGENVRRTKREESEEEKSDEEDDEDDEVDVDPLPDLRRKGEKLNMATDDDDIKKEKERKNKTKPLKNRGAASDDDKPATKRTTKRDTKRKTGGTGGENVRRTKRTTKRDTSPEGDRNGRKVSFDVVEDPALANLPKKEKRKTGMAKLETETKKKRQSRADDDDDIDLNEFDDYDKRNKRDEQPDSEIFTLDDAIENKRR